MQKVLDKSCLISSALVPIFICVAVRAFNSLSACWLGYTCLGFILIGISGALYLRYRASGNASSPRITAVESAGSEATGYIASLIIPIVTLSAASFDSILLVAIFVVVYVLVALQANALAVNPLLYVLGYQIWRVQSSDIPDGEAIYIGRRRPRLGAANDVSFRNGIMFERTA